MKKCGGDIEGLIVVLITDVPMDDLPSSDGFELSNILSFGPFGFSDQGETSLRIFSADDRGDCNESVDFDLRGCLLSNLGETGIGISEGPVFGDGDGDG